VFDHVKIWLDKATVRCLGLGNRFERIINRTIHSRLAHHSVRTLHLLLIIKLSILLKKPVYKSKLNLVMDVMMIICMLITRPCRY